MNNPIDLRDDYMINRSFLQQDIDIIETDDDSNWIVILKDGRSYILRCSLVMQFSGNIITFK